MEEQFKKENLFSFFLETINLLEFCVKATDKLKQNKMEEMKNDERKIIHRSTL